MENKQTAVEWFASEVLKLNRELVSKTISIDGFIHKSEQILERAKQMEKEQIMKAYESGCIGEQFELNCNQSKEEYYTKTYGK